MSCIENPSNRNLLASKSFSRTFSLYSSPIVLTFKSSGHSKRLKTWRISFWLSAVEIKIVFSGSSATEVNCFIKRSIPPPGSPMHKIVNPRGIPPFIILSNLGDPMLALSPKNSSSSRSKVTFLAT